MATLDYGHEVAGVPIFEVDSVSGKVQIEVKFSEEFAGLDAVYSDGPFPFATALSNTYRVETFEIITPGQLVQIREVMAIIESGCLRLEMTSDS